MDTDSFLQGPSDQDSKRIRANFDAQTEAAQIQLIYTLGRQHKPAHFDLLIQLLEHAQGEVRCAIIDALTHDPERALPILVTELQHPDLVVRWVASGLLSNLHDIRTVPALLGCLTSDPDSDVRINAALALGHIGDVRALPALEQVTRHDHSVGRHGHAVHTIAAAAITEILQTQTRRISE
ncbi:MAG: HEAT repeat domain-containing protein [Burkholderiales bacterium]